MKQLCTLLCAFPCCANAQNDAITKQLEEVVVGSFRQNDSLLKAPASVGIVSKADFERNNTTDISTSLNQVSGVLMQSATLNTNRITIRGIGARTSFGTNKIRAFFGIIPLTSGDGETTIEDLDLENLAQAEIVKGPLSSLYGAGLGGAILLSPKAPENKLLASAVHGSFGLVKNSFGAGLQREKTEVNLYYNSLNSGGWRENSSYRREGVTLSGMLFKTAKSRLTFIGNHTYLKAFIPSSIDRETFENNPQSAAPTWLASKGYEQYVSWFGGLGYEARIGKVENATSVFASGKRNDEPRPFDILRQDTNGWGFRTQFSMTIDKMPFKPLWIAGAEYFGDRLESGTFQNLYEQNNGNGSLRGARLSAVRQDRGFWKAFAQVRFAFYKKWSLQAGVNYNATAFALTDVFPDAQNQKFRYGAIWSPQASLVFAATQSHLLYASASRGFSFPAISETLNENGLVNKDIRPETGVNVEVGAKSYFLNRRLYGEISIFHLSVSDLLVAKRVDDDRYVGINAGKTTHTGIEASGKCFFPISEDWTASGYLSGSFGRFRFSDFSDAGNDFSGNELTGVPSFKANVGATICFKKLYLNLDFIRVGEFPMNDANTLYNDAYQLLHVKSGYRFGILTNLEGRIAAGVNNVFDSHYAPMVLVNATGTAPRYYYPGLPANFYAHVSFAYAFSRRTVPKT
jgi:iron complex outermembrane receptor protein